MMNRKQSQPRHRQPKLICNQQLKSRQKNPSREVKVRRESQRTRQSHPKRVAKTHPLMQQLVTQTTLICR